MKLILDTHCPTCRAQVGQPCRRPNGDRVLTVHGVPGYHTARSRHSNRAPASCCDELRTCDPCGEPVCAEHSAETTSCVETGTHHLTCVSDCTDCRRAHDQDVADDLASGYANERGR